MLLSSNISLLSGLRFLLIFIELYLILKTGFLSFIFILAATFAVKIYAQKKLYIKRGKEDYSIVKYTSILEDEQSKLTIQQAASDSMQNK